MIQHIKLTHNPSPKELIDQLQKKLLFHKHRKPTFGEVIASDFKQIGSGVVDAVKHIPSPQNIVKGVGGGVSQVIKTIGGVGGDIIDAGSGILQKTLKGVGGATGEGINALLKDLLPMILLLGGGFLALNILLKKIE